MALRHLTPVRPRLGLLARLVWLSFGGNLARVGRSFGSPGSVVWLSGLSFALLAFLLGSVEGAAAAAAAAAGPSAWSTVRDSALHRRPYVVVHPAPRLYLVYPAA